MSKGTLLMLVMLAPVHCGPSESRTLVNTAADVDSRPDTGGGGRSVPPAGGAGGEAQGMVSDASGSFAGVGGAGGGAGGSIDGSVAPGTGGGGGIGGAAGAYGEDGGAEAAGPLDAGPPPAEASVPDGPAPLAPDAAPAMSSLNVGLVSRWRLDEGNGLSTADDTASGNHGTLQGGAAWIQSGYPSAQYVNPAALRFDGVDDFVELGFSGLPANNQSQSISFWVNYAAIPIQTSGGGQLFVSLTDGMPNGSRLKLGFLRSRIAVWKFGSIELVGATPPPPGWHHVVYILDAGTHQLWIDGARQEAPTVPPQAGVVRNARLGAGFDGAEAFQGELDEVRIYNRPLNPAEVAALRAGQQ